MVPYTREAIAALRNEARRGTPAEHVREFFGWDSATLAQRCMRHQIDLVSLAPAPALPADPASVKPSPRPLFNAAPNLAAIIAKLTPRQAEIFRFLRSHAHSGQIWNADHIRHAINAESTTSTRAVGVSTKALARRLERMGAEYRIERRKGQGGGFRLVYGEPAP